MNASIRTALLVTLFAAASGASELTAQDAMSADAETPPEPHLVAGTVLNPGGTVPMDVSFEFTGSGDDLQAALLVPAMDLRLELLEPHFDDTKFTFAFVEPGGNERIECTLFRDSSDAFSGDCMEEGGGAPGQMTVEPTGY